MVLIAVALTAALLWWADPRELLTVVSRVNLASLLGLCMLQLATIALISRQWQLLVLATGNRIGYLTMVSIILAGSFTETITPAVKAGGEATKVVLLQKNSQLGLSGALAVTAAQKALSMVAFALLTLFSLPWAIRVIPVDPALRSGLLWAQGVMLGLIILTGLFFVLLRLPQLPAPRWIAGFRQSMALLTGNWQLMAGQFFLAVAIWTLFALKAVLVVWVLGMEISMAATAAVTYLSYLAGMAPLPGGLGAFEGAAALLLTGLSVTPENALAFALVLRFVTFWFVFLVSGLWLLFRWGFAYRLNETAAVSKE